MGKLKSINWKELVLDHGEKFILGMVLIFVLGSVATTQWGTYEKTPEEFQVKITQGESTFNASRWPTEEETAFVARDPGDEVAKLLDGTPQGLPLFQYSTRWVWPIRKRKAKLREPELLPPVELVADAAQILLNLQPETKEAATFDVELASVGELEATNNVPPGDPANPNVPTVQAPRIEAPRADARSNAPGGVPGAGQIPGIGGGYDYGGDEGDDDDGAAAMSGFPGQSGLPGPDGASSGLPGVGGASAYGMGGGAKTIVGEARGLRFVSLRGVIPMKLIVDRFRQALNLDTPQEAFFKVQFWDFELERQTARPGADPWSGDWEVVDIQDTIKLLDRLEFDLDIVEEKYRDSVFTMPLPYRVTGSWDKAIGQNGLIASHPTIKRILTKQEQLAEEALNLATLRAAEKAKQIKQEQKAGFAFVQHDTGAMRNQMRGDQEMMSLFNESMQEVMEEDMADEGLEMEMMSSMSMGSGGGFPGGMSPGYPGGAARGGANRQQQQVVTIPQSLLFRFLDFSVVPGNAYRYRLRLKLQNPNFDRDPAELLDVSSREGKFRHTPWSEASTPAVVQEETHLFVEKVDDRRGVSINAYQWMTDSGTYVSGLFEGLSRGEKVAAWTMERKGRRGAESTLDGGVVTDVLRPAHETFMEERIDYVTPHSLVDFERTTVVSPDEFPDLELTSKRIPLALEEVVTINRFGELHLIDSDRQGQGYTGWKGLMAQQKTLWAHLRKAAAPTGTALLLGSGGQEQPTRSRGRRRGSGKRSLGGEGFDPYGGAGGAYGGNEMMEMMGEGGGGYLPGS